MRVRATDAIAVLVFFSLGFNLIIPVLTKQEPVLADSLESDPEAYIYHSASSPGMISQWKVNFSNWKRVVRDAFDWGLQASENGIDWVDAKPLLNLNVSFLPSTQDAKITLTVNTHPTKDLYYRFYIICNQSLRSYINRTDNYEVSFELPANSTEYYNLVFNWSDLIPLIKQGEITTKHGLKDERLFFVIQSVNKVQHGIQFVVDPRVGTMVKSVVSSYEFQPQQGEGVASIRLGTSEYYLVVCRGDTQADGWAYTLHVWDNNGTIEQRIIDSYEFYPIAGAYGFNYPSITLVNGSTNVYALAFQSSSPSGTVALTLRAWESNGTIQKKILDQLTVGVRCTSNAQITFMNRNIYAVILSEITTVDGWLYTIAIDPNGLIGDTVNSSAEFEPENCYYPDSVKIDSNTLAAFYRRDVATVNGDRHIIETFNISSTGNITSNSSWYQIPGTRDNWGLSIISKIPGTDYFIIANSSSGSSYLRTVKIHTNGTIIKSIIDTLRNVYTEGSSRAIEPIYGSDRAWMWWFEDSAGDGWIYTFNVSKTNGDIDSSFLDTFEYEPDYSANTADLYVIHTYKDYYFVAFAGPDTGANTTLDGWAKTVNISSQYWRGVNTTIPTGSSWTGTIQNDTTFNNFSSFSGSLTNNTTFKSISTWTGNIYNDTTKYTYTEYFDDDLLLPLTSGNPDERWYDSEITISPLPYQRGNITDYRHTSGTQSMFLNSSAAQPSTVIFDLSNDTELTNFSYNLYLWKNPKTTGMSDIYIVIGNDSGYEPIVIRYFWLSAANKIFLSYIHDDPNPGTETVLSSDWGNRDRWYNEYILFNWTTYKFNLVSNGTSYGWLDMNSSSCVNTSYIQFSHPLKLAHNVFLDNLSITGYNQLTPGWMRTGIWSGTIENDTSFVLDSTWDGTLSNTTSQSGISNWTGTLENTTTFNNFSSWNGNLYNLTPNTAPIIDDVIPHNNSIDISMNIAWFNVTCHDIEGDLMTIHAELISEGCAQLYDSGGSFGNGTVSMLVNQPMCCPLNPLTTYTWYVNITDSFGAYTNRTYVFTTEDSRTFIEDDNWTGTIENNTFWSTETWTGTLTNDTVWNLTSIWDGTLLNSTSFSNISLWDGTLINSTSFVLVSDWLGTIVNTSSFSIYGSWTGTLVNDTSFVLDTAWTGSLTNDTSFRPLGWLGTIYDDTPWVTIPWSGSLFNGTGTVTPHKDEENPSPIIVISRKGLAYFGLVLLALFLIIYLSERKKKEPSPEPSATKKKFIRKWIRPKKVRSNTRNHRRIRFRNRSRTR
jgi:hypothetical protein